MILPWPARPWKKLYRIYREPIYNFICRQYHCNHPEAEDLTQGFFEHLIEKATVRRADRDIGKFRTFLLGALKYFRANERDRILAGKRGGKCQIISLDETDAPQVHGHEPPVAVVADKAFNQDWAFALVKQAREQLKEKYVKEEKSLLFATMEPALLREDAKDLYAQWAAALEIEPGSRAGGLPPVAAAIWQSSAPRSCADRLQSSGRQGGTQAPPCSHCGLRALPTRLAVIVPPVCLRTVCETQLSHV